MAPWQALLSFGVSMFMFGLGYFVGRRRTRVVPGLLCRVTDGPEEGKFVGLAEDGTVLMDLRGPAPELPDGDDGGDCT